jgi:hypothetical protein
MPILPLTRKLLKDFGNNAVNKMKQNANKYKASGTMANSFKYEILTDEFVIWGVDYVKYFEDGRGATKNKAKSTPTLQERILQWIKVKPIPIWEGYTQESMAYVIARKIHKEGVSWYRSKKKRTIYSNVINATTLTRLYKQIGQTEQVSITSDVTKVMQLSFEKGLA